MDMLCLLEYLRIDIRQTHKIHGSLVRQVGAVLVITHADSRTGCVLVLTNQITRIYTFRFQRTLYQIAETIIADHAAECHFGTQRRSISREDSC